MGFKNKAIFFTKVVFIALRTNLFNIVLATVFNCLMITPVLAQELNNKSIAIESETAVIDSTRTDSIVSKKKILEDNVKYNAQDYVKMDQKKKSITLYNQAEVYYQDIEIKAGIIEINYDKNEVYAGRIKDSLGNYSQIPEFKQGANIIKPDSMRFNFKSKKTLIWNSITDQGDFNVKGEVTKKENDSVYFIKNAIFTTSEDVNNPEYYFKARRIKMVPKKKVVSGLMNMFIADVPTPIGLPFAFFPMTEDKSSGFIIPTYTDTNLRGYALQNGGYYFNLTEYYDLSILGDYYTNGSYATRFNSNYALRYKFSGNLNFRYENLINSERGFPDYSKSTIYNIQWTHSQDSKANPNSRFSASVNLGSSDYYQQSINQSNTASYLNNTLSSSISYSKTFTTVPQVNLSLTATHSQNTQTEQINMTLPTLQASVDRIYPFAPKTGSKKGFIKNLNLQYNLRGENRITTTDSLFFTSEMFEDALVGLRHSIPISTNFKVFKHFSMSTNFNYDDVWYLETIQKNYDATENKVITQDVNGFDRYGQYSFSSSLGTTLYGTFNFKNSKKIQAIRHVVRPSLSYSFTPSFDQYYDTYIVDASGNYGDYTRFEKGIFGAPGKNLSNNIGLNIGNALEAKVIDKEKEDKATKKVKLINNLSLSTYYNIAADSLAWSPMRVTGGTNLFKDKVSLNVGATFDPYAINNQGTRIEKYNIDNGGSLFRMTSANMNINYSIKSGNGGRTNADQHDDLSVRNGGRSDDLFGTANDQLNQFNNIGSTEEEKSEEKDKKPESKFYNAKLPWDLRFAYSMTYSNNNRQGLISNNSLMFSGNIKLTPMWSVGGSSGYDFVQKGFTYTQLRFGRDLKSWRMDFSWIPFSTRASWYFFIGIKSSVLSDIKWEKRTVPDRIIN